MSMIFGEKVERFVRFLIGLRNRRVAGALAAHGFTQAELEEAWRLFRLAVGEELSVAPVQPVDVEALEQLDVWENRWFPIARAALDARLPEIGAEVFLNLSQAEGAEVVITVGTLLERLAGLATGDSAHQEARQLLEARGLTPAVCGQAQALLERLERIESPPAPDTEATRAARAASEDAMWRWYLEWSAISRAAIKDGRLLRLLGFGAQARRRRALAEDGPDVAGEPPPDGSAAPDAPPSATEPA